MKLKLIFFATIFFIANGLSAQAINQAKLETVAAMDVRPGDVAVLPGEGYLQPSIRWEAKKHNWLKL